MTDEQITARTLLPPGDISWDGETLTAGGVELAPGEYQIGPAVLVVHAAIDDAFDPLDDDE